MQDQAHTQADILGLEIQPEVDVPPRAPGLGSVVAPSLIAFGVTLGGVFVVRALRNRNRRGVSVGKTGSRGSDTTDGALRTAARRSVEDAVELTQQLSAQLESKAVALRTLLEEIDRKMESVRDGLPGLQGEAQRPAQSGTQMDARLGGLTGGAPRQQSPALAREDAGIDPLHAKVAGMARDGAAPLQIARQLGKPVGQIELILALNRAA